MKELFNANANTPPEAYGIDDARYNEIVDHIAGLATEHYFMKLISLTEFLTKSHALAKNDAELLCVHFTMGTAIANAKSQLQQLRLAMNNRFSKGGVDRKPPVVLRPGEA